MCVWWCGGGVANPVTLAGTPMRQVTISIKVLWLVFVLDAATDKKKGKTVKKWNMRDHSDSFCSLKYNENGRYISFIDIQGGDKSIIITTTKGPFERGLGQYCSEA